MISYYFNHGRDIGVRFHPTRGGSSIGPSKGGYGPESLCEEEADMLADMQRLIDTHHDNSK
jgi:8-oxoguanine deaminase